MPQKHSHPHPHGRAYWWTERLWREAADLPQQLVPIESIREFEEDCWFGGDEPTIRRVAEHSARIAKADLSYPVILASDGHLMDGGHRIAKAWLNGETHVRAVRFVTDPEPDWIS